MASREPSARKLHNAYRTGNLDALVSAMSGSQQAEWYRAVVRQALWYLEPLLETPDEQQVAAMARLWLDAPSGAQADAIIEFALQSGMVSPLSVPGFAPQNRIQRVQMLMPRTLNGHPMQQLLLALVADTPETAISAVGTIALRRAPSSGNASSMLARRWQLDAAWAILNDQPVPPLEGFSGQDREADYRAGKLGALLEAMTADQQALFRYALFEQSVSRIPPPPDELIDPVRTLFEACLRAARRWLDQPTVANAEEVHKEASAVERAAPPRAAQGIQALGLLADLRGFARDEAARVAARAAQTLSQTLTADPETAAGAIVALDVSLFLAVDMDETFDEDTADLPTEPTRSQQEWWQVEAAWAILNDRPVPPLP